MSKVKQRLLTRDTEYLLVPHNLNLQSCILRATWYLVYTYQHHRIIPCKVHGRFMPPAGREKQCCTSSWAPTSVCHDRLSQHISAFVCFLEPCLARTPFSLLSGIPGTLLRRGLGASAASRNGAIICGKRGRPTSAGTQPVRLCCQ